MTTTAEDLNNTKKEVPAKKRAILAYCLLPGIIPQIKELTRGGFGYLALLIANVYQAVRILPANHPYTRYENLGRFGLRQVITAAAGNIKLERKNLDQIIIFFAVLAGLIILALQFISFFLLVMSGEAFAQDADSFGGIFKTQNPDTDIAFSMMREVFGIPDMFGSLEGGRTPFHQALHNMLQFYNLAILLVAVLIFVYYVIVVVAETATTGTPFGQRFSHIYAPIRLVVAIGLLVPLNYGLNSAQYITLFAAKIGSGFATTGWLQFTEELTNPVGQENATLIAQTKNPDVEGLVKFMSVAVTCREAYKLDDITIRPIYAYTRLDGTKGYDDTPGYGSTGVTSVAGSLRDIKVYFGDYGDEDEPLDGSAIAGKPPECGSVVVPITTPMNTVTEEGELVPAPDGSPGALPKKYIAMITLLWLDSKLEDIGKDIAVRHYAMRGEDRSYEIGSVIPANLKEAVYTEYRAWLDRVLRIHYQQGRANLDMSMREDTKKRGWGGAGIWYNRIAEINGAYVVAILNLPSPQLFPNIMEEVREAKRSSDTTYNECEAFNPNLANNVPVRTDIDPYYTRTFNDVYKYWHCENTNTNSNIFLDTASAIFGLNGLLSIRDKVTIDDPDSEDPDDTIDIEIHPLAKLSALGKGLIESAVRSLAMAVGTSFLGGMLGILGPHIGPGLMAASTMFSTVATIGLSIGFITYYILPFFPFIYFFFAVGSWVKSIFEAMVGTPLWALAHLRIDGDGLPGKMAMNGYLLIFEIFLRPILTVFGLLGGMAIFTSMALILNEIFDLVVVNTGGIDLSRPEDQQFSRHIIDEFFFTCIYAVILYMMAVSSFKMITLVPNNILRWMGQNISSFSDGAPDPTQGLIQYGALGGARIGGQLAGGVTRLGEAGGTFLGGVGQTVGLGGRQGGNAP